MSRDCPQQLVIALEPEAAAIFCTERKMDAIQSDRLNVSIDGLLSQLNSQYMVVDIGGNALIRVLITYFIVLYCIGKLVHNEKEHSHWLLDRSGHCGHCLTIQTLDYTTQRSNAKIRRHFRFSLP